MSVLWFERLILSFVLQVTQQHAGQYSCQPFNQRGSAAPSPIIQVIIKDPPTLLSRPNNEYIKNVGGKVSFSCQAAGTPTPDIRWRRVRISIFNKVYFKYVPEPHFVSKNFSNPILKTCSCPFVWYFCTLFWDDITIICWWKLSKQTSYWSKTGFFSIKKVNNIFIPNYRDIIPK